MLKRFVAAAILWAGLLGFAPSALAQNAPDCSQFNIDQTAAAPLTVVATPSDGGCAPLMSNGYPIPDPKCTPGAVNPTVTQAVLQNPAFTTKCLRDITTTATEKAQTYGWYATPHPLNNTGQNQ